MPAAHTALLVSPNRCLCCVLLRNGIRNAIGTPLVMNYVWDGLFHPARKVRQPYWRIYNNAYVQWADAMTPAYPTFEEEKVVWTSQGYFPQ